jgi:hypothetical protein
MAAASNRPANAHQIQGTPLVSAGSPSAVEDGEGLALGDALIVTDRVTVDGLGAAVTVWVVVVSTRIGDRDGFVAADRVAVGS